MQAVHFLLSDGPGSTTYLLRQALSAKKVICQISSLLVHPSFLPETLLHNLSEIPSFLVLSEIPHFRVHGYPARTQHRFPPFLPVYLTTLVSNKALPRHSVAPSP